MTIGDKMKKLNILCLALLLVVVSLPINIQAETLEESISYQVPDFEERPYASHFFPKDFLDWDFEKDPDAIHNVSKTPLAKRVQGPKINPDQDEKFKVASLAIMNKNTSGTPSQGSNEKAIYNFSYWQYIDVLVGWAGSAGEGLIVPPSADVIDVAHRNGVPVLGVVFFPPTAYGGKAEWIEQFLVKDEHGHFPIADKLIEMMELYGFDGWFINQETNTNSAEHSKLFQEFMIYYQNIKPKDSYLMWYDSMIEQGSVSWQNTLNEQNEMFFQKGKQKVSDLMFLNFWWEYRPSLVDDARNHALKLNRDPYDLFSGIDVQARGVNTSAKPSMLFDENGKAKTSLGLYAPDWSLRDGAKEDIDQYWENEKNFWVNQKADPRDTSMTKDQWQGISRYAVEKSSVTQLPFSTSFNIGHGDNFYLDGKLVKEGSFNNRSLQDVLPTYRWIIDQDKNNLKADFTYEDAFKGGSSILIEGETIKGETSKINLYHSQIRLDKDAEAKIVFKGDADVKLQLSINGENASLSQTKKENINGWTQITYDLKPYKSQTIDNISVIVEGSENKENSKTYLGMISINEKSKKTVKSIKNFKVLSHKSQDNVISDLRVRWDHDDYQVRHYNLYQEVNGKWIYQGSSASNAYYLENIRRQEQAEVKLAVVPVDQNLQEHWDASDVSTYIFDEIPLPSGHFDINKTFVEIGEEIEIKASVSPSTKSIKWIVEGAENDLQEGKEITANFTKPGIYTIRMILTNNSGQTTVTKENIVQVYDESLGLEKKNLSLDILEENVTVSGACAPHEGAMGAFDDNLGTKWCDNANKKPEMKIDLGSNKSITDFKIFHAEAGGEQREWNSRDYEIHVSLDNENWEKIVHRTDNVDAISSESIPLTEARYIHFILNKAEQTGDTARIYEFQINGFDEVDLQVHPLAKELSSLRSTVYNLEVKKDLYTAESYESFKKNRDLALSILKANGEIGGKELNREEVERIEKDLIATYNNLILKIEENKNLLKETIHQGKKLDSQKYTEESYQVLNAAINHGINLLSKENVSHEEILEAIQSINKAISGLIEYKGTENLNPENNFHQDEGDIGVNINKNDKTNTGKTEDNTNLDKKDKEIVKKEEQGSKNDFNIKIDKEGSHGSQSLPKTGIPNLLSYLSIAFTASGYVLYKKRQEK